MVNKEQSSDVSLAPDEVSGKLNSSSTIINDIKKLWECTLYMEIFSKASRIEEPVWDFAWASNPTYEADWSMQTSRGRNGGKDLYERNRRN